jgi:hypothetical protein
MSHVVEAKMTPTQKGWLLTGTQKDIGVIRLHLPAHYLLTPHVSSKKVTADAKSKTSAETKSKMSSGVEKVTVSASIKRRPDIEKAALAGGITLVDKDTVPDTQQARTLSAANPKKVGRGGVRPRAPSKLDSGVHGDDSNRDGAVDNKSSVTSGTGGGSGGGGGGNRKTSVAKKKPKSKSSLKVKVEPLLCDTDVNKTAEEVADTTLVEVDSDIEMQEVEGETEASATKEDVAVDEKKGSVFATTGKEVKGKVWTRRARHLKVWRMWLMLEAADIDADAKTRRDVGDDRALMKAHFAIVLETATPTQLRNMQNWVENYFIDKKQRKAQRAAK